MLHHITVYAIIFSLESFIIAADASCNFSNLHIFSESICWLHIKSCINNLKNIVRNPLLRNYQKIKTNFQQEPYLYLIKEHKHRVALSRLRASSHTLEIERGRHDRPKKPIEARLCYQCTLIEDELHFVCQCMINNDARECMYVKLIEYIEILTIWAKKANFCS